MREALGDKLARLPEDVRALLAEYCFDVGSFLSLASRVQSDGGIDNRVSDPVLPPGPGDIDELPERGTERRTELERIGQKALESGKVALVVLAGGMATRMGGVVKALAEALPGRTFLDLHLAEREAIARTTGTRPPLWLMTSHATDGAIRDALAQSPRGEGVRAFRQRLSLRLTPEGDLYVDGSGRPSFCTPGHGDAIDALRDGGLLGDFLASGGTTIMVTNLDNLGGTLDEAILGFHLSSGAKVTSEVVDRSDADRGALLVRRAGRLTVLEDLRLPPQFDVSSAPVFNINTFHFDAAALVDLRPPWSYLAVRKKVKGADVLQFERLINEVVDWLPTRFLRVPRLGVHSRFLPVKDSSDLEARRHEIEAVVKER
jgi:UTP--glucose-1-phosphate uridylyltransferase